MEEGSSNPFSAVIPNYFKEKYKFWKEDTQIKNAYEVISTLDASRTRFEDMSGACLQRYMDNKERAKKYIKNGERERAKYFSQIATVSKRQSQRYQDKGLLIYISQEKLAEVIETVVLARHLKSAVGLAKNMLVGNDKINELEDVAEDVEEQNQMQGEIENLLTEITKSSTQSILSGFKNFDKEQQEEMEDDPENPTNKLLKELEDEITQESDSMQALQKLDNANTLPSLGSSVSVNVVSSSHHNNNNSGSGSGLVPASALATTQKRNKLEEIEEL